MGDWVLRRNEDGKFVAHAGSEHSYTSSLRRAERYDDADHARGCACGNETPASVESLLGQKARRG